MKINIRTVLFGISVQKFECEFQMQHSTGTVIKGIDLTRSNKTELINYFILCHMNTQRMKSSHASGALFQLKVSFNE